MAREYTPVQSRWSPVGERALRNRIDAAIVSLQAYGKLEELRKLLTRR